MRQRRLSGSFTAAVLQMHFSYNNQAVIEAVYFDQEML